MKNTIIAIASAALLSSVAAADDTKKFDGAFAGVEAGYIDFGASDAFLYGAEAGYRKQFNNNVVVGVEGTFSGVDLNGVDFLWSTTLTAGRTFGADNNHLLFLGAGLAQINTDFGSDEAFKTDLGYEYALENGMSLRVKATTYDFDDFQTTAGISYRF